MMNMTPTQVESPVQRAMFSSSSLAAFKTAFALWVEGGAFSTDAAILAKPVTEKVFNASGK
jgi:hypothetical protein